MAPLHRAKSEDMPGARASYERRPPFPGLRASPPFAPAPPLLTMPDSSPVYARSVKQLDDSYRALVNVCSTLPADSASHKILNQLGFHIDGFVGQAWPAEVNAGLARVYSDLARVIKDVLRSSVPDGRKQALTHIDCVLVSTCLHAECWARLTWKVTGYILRLRILLDTSPLQLAGTRQVNKLRKNTTDDRWLACRRNVMRKVYIHGDILNTARQELTGDSHVIRRCQADSCPLWRNPKSHLQEHQRGTRPRAPECLPMFCLHCCGNRLGTCLPGTRRSHRVDRIQ